jgi:predicted GIY-YIG superfamily endonuclease
VKIGIYQIRNLIDNKIYIGSSFMLEDRLKRTHSEETKEKLRKIKLGKSLSHETREKMSKSRNV